MAVSLHIENVSKTYKLRGKTVEVLRGASLDVAEGERVAIIGKSGSGKSTLLHLLGGLDRPDPNGGRVVIGGTDLYSLSSGRRAVFRAENIGFVFQSYHLLPEMDIVENTLLPAFAAGHRGRASRARAVELLEKVGLGDRLEHTPLELSGGEQQRAALARALMNEPGLILADEPTGNLDAVTGGQVLEHLFGLSGGHTLVMVTHSPEIAAKCDRIVNLRDGGLFPG